MFSLESANKFGNHSIVQYMYFPANSNRMHVRACLRNHYYLTTMARSASFAVAVCLLLLLSRAGPGLCGGRLVYTVLSASTDPSSGAAWSHEYCAVYYSEWGDAPALSSPAATDYYPTTKLHSLCNPLNASTKGEAVTVKSETCTFYDQALNAQLSNASLLVIVYNDSSLNGLSNSGDSFSPNQTTRNITLVVAMVTNVTGKELFSHLNSSTGLYLTVYTPPSPPIDPSAVLTLLIAVGTVIFGTLLANKPWDFLRYGLLSRKGEHRNVANSPERVLEGSKGPKDIAGVVIIVLVFVLLLCTLLVLLYLFYYPLVYVVISLYCIGTFIALYCLLSPFIALIPLCADWRLPEVNLPIMRLRPDPRFFLTLMGCAGIVVWWAVERHAPYAWVLQDILGFAFVTLLFNRLLFFRVWVLSMLMVLLLFYDIFMVFITPYITKDHESIMVKAATGGVGSKEQLPIVFIAPKFVRSHLDTACAEYSGYLPYSLLGYGDVGIPGLLVALSLKFDLEYGKWRYCKLYYTVTIIGLVVTYVALVLMQNAQPALLYLVPATLGSVIVTSLLRKEFKFFFTGKQHTKGCSCSNKDESEEEGEEEEREDEETSEEGERDVLIDEESVQL